MIVENLNDLLSDFRLGNAEKWKQLFTNRTTHCQIAFQNLVIGISNGDVYESIIVSSCILLEDESSKTQVESMKAKVNTQQF